METSSIIFRAAISKDSKFIAYADWDHYVYFLSIETRKEQTLGKHDDRVTSIAISDDSNLIVTGSFDKSIRIWNRETKGYSIIGKHEDGV